MGMGMLVKEERFDITTVLLASTCQEGCSTCGLRVNQEK